MKQKFTLIWEDESAARITWFEADNIEQVLACDLVKDSLFCPFDFDGHITCRGQVVDPSDVVVL